MGRLFHHESLVTILLAFACCDVVWAAPAALTYQGRIVTASGAPLEHTSVSFQFEILNPSGSCVIYREQVNGINMKNSGGVFDVKIGASHSYPAAPSFSILDSFNNSGSFVCDGGVAYNPTLADGRLLRVQFYDGSAWRAITPDSVIRSVPFAAYAEAANRIGTHGATDFVLKTDVNGGAHCSGGSFLTWNATTQSFGCAAEASGGGGGSGTVTEIFSANSYLTVANSTTTPTLTLNVGTTANTVAAGNDVRLTNARIPTGAAGGDLSGNYPNPSVAKIQGVGIDFSAAPGAGDVLTFDGNNWVAQTLPAASSGTVTGITAGTGLTGGTISTSGTIGLGTALSGLNSIATNGYIQRTGAGTYTTTAGNVSASNNTLVLRDGSGVSSFYGVGIAGATSGNITWQAPLISDTYSLTLPDAQGAANQVMANDGTGILSWINVPAAPGAACGAGNVLTYNGTAFTCVPDQVGSSGGGIVTLNSQTGSSQSFAAGTTGTLPNWSSASDVHTLNIPFARTASVTAGLISKTEYDTFNSKQNALGFTPLNPGNNLSELTDASTARTNLGLGTAALINAPTSGNAAVGEVVLGDDTRLSNSRTPSGAAGGDLGGTYPNPDVNRLKGVGLSMTGLSSGNFLKYNGTNWVNSLIDPSDVTGLVTALGSKIDQSQIVGTCSSSKTLVFSSVTGSWTCTDISITGTQVAYASQTQNYVFAAPSGGNGAPTFRALAATDLPTSVQNSLWTASSTNIYRPTGMVGIGTLTPTKTLDIHNPSSSAEVVLSSGAGGTIGNYLKLMTSRPDLTKDTNGSTYGSGNKSWAIGALNDAHPSYPGSLIFMRNDDASQPTRMTLTSDGNLGLGVLVPAQKLEVAAGNIKIESGYGLGASFSAASMAAYYPYLTNMNAKAGLGPVLGYNEASFLVSDQVIAFGEADNDTVVGAMDVNARRFYWDGNLGLGTQGVATSRLHIINSAGADPADDIRMDAYGTTTPGILMYRARGTYEAATAVQEGDFLGSFLANGYNGSAFVRAATITSVASNDWTTTASTNNSYLSFKVTNSGTNTERMVLSKTGQLGLGTNAPAYELDVRAASPVLNLHDTNAAGDAASAYLRFTDSGGVRRGYIGDGSSSNDDIHIQADTGLIRLNAMAAGGYVYIDGATSNCSLGNGTGATACSSDIRLKKNVRNLAGSLDKIMQISGVSFEWKSEPGTPRIGFIAQDVQKQFPEAVIEDKEGFLMLDYGSLVSPVLQALKEFYEKWVSDSQSLHRELEVLKQENKEQREEIEAMKSYICSENPKAKICR